MALSGSFILTRTSGTQYLQGRVEWSAVQNPVDNTSTVTARLIFRRTNTGYTTYGTGTFTLSIDGNEWSTEQVSYSFTSSDKVMLEKSITLSHGADGVRGTTIAATYTGNSPIGGNGSQSVSLNTIDRNPPVVSLSIGQVTDNAIAFSASANAACNTWQYTLDGGSSWNEYSQQNTTATSGSLTGLSPATSYQVAVRAYRSYNRVYGTSAVREVKTIGNAVLAEVEDLAADLAAPVLNMKWTVYSGNYTYKLEIMNDSAVLVTLSGLTAQAGNTDKAVSLSTANRAALLGWLSGAKELTATYRLTTYSGGVQIGSPSVKTGRVYTTAQTSAPSFVSGPAFTYLDTNSKTVAVTGDSQQLIQGQSSLKVTVAQAVAKNGASIKSYSVSVGGNLVSGAGRELTYGAVTSSGSVTVTVTATDSRGYTCSATGTVPVLSYQPVQIRQYSLARVNNYETYCKLQLSGSVSLLSQDGTNKNSLQTLRYRKRASGASWGSYVTLTPELSGSSFSFDSSAFETLDRASAWEFEFSASDRLTSDTITLTVERGTPTISVRKNKVGINNYDPQAALDIQGDVMWNGMHLDTAMKKDPGQTGKDTYTLLAQYQVSAANRDFTEVYSATAKYMPYEIYGNNSMLFELSMRTGSSSLGYFNIRYLTPPLRGTQICASIQGSGVNLTIKVYAYCVDMWTEVKFNVISENRNPEHITRVLYTDQEPVSSISGTIVFGEYWGGSLPNLIINSDFAISQRNLETWAPGNEYGGYGVDRWKTTSTASCQRVKNDCPKYFSESNAYYKLRINCKNSAYNSVYQPFENFSQYIGKSMTISFAATCKNSGTVRCGIGNSSFLVPLFAGKWKKVTLYVENITAHSNSDLNGLWLQTENNSSTAGNIGYWEIAGVQVCLGKGVGTYVSPNPATEMVKCQRFYEVGRGVALWVETNNNGLCRTCPIQFKVEKRVVPTMTVKQETNSGITVDNVYTSQFSGFAGVRVREEVIDYIASAEL